MAHLNRACRRMLRKHYNIQTAPEYSTAKNYQTTYSKAGNVIEQPPFQKILVANRGEIACRIITTAKKMGIKTVAVFSAVDAASKHVKLADEAIFIGPAVARESYLNMAKIYEAVTKTHAEAVHPGYGFLSENPIFVKMLEEKGVIFIGPSAEAIAEMGDKLRSKRLATAAGVNTIPGYDGIIMDANECAKIAEHIGYPVIIKASAGGGGKGMRIAKNDKEIREGFKMATQEALASFGDGRILVEKFIEKARHIEIQVLGDKHGKIVHLNERECSIQRRNQKIIEEAPSPFLDDETRISMGDQAIALCKQIGYYSAGTVEFLVDKHRNFYFLEMNTRLQVEHPVSEYTTGINLVREMIRIAKGLPLNINQEEIKINGWAIESRIYAENPYKNFGLPSTGQLYAYREPHSEGVRCDSGVEEGSAIGIYYDPMICKLICHGKSREEAIERSIGALDSYVIYGVTNNVPLLRDILKGERFIKGDVSTNYLSEVYGESFKGRELNAGDKKKLMAIALSIYATQELRKRCYINDVQIHSDGLEKWELVVFLLEEPTTADVSLDNDNFTIKIQDEIFKVAKFPTLSTHTLKSNINGEEVLTQLYSKDSVGNIELIFQGTKYEFKVLPKLAFNFLSRMPKQSKNDGPKVIKSPMPGLVNSIACKVGDEVIEGQEVCIIEAMKMQNSMVSGVSGKIKRIFVHKGVAVGTGDVLLQIE